MITENSPRVSKLIGSVKNPTIGFINVLMIDKTIATTTAVKKLSIETLGRRYAVIATASAFTNNLTSSFIFFCE